MKLSKSPDMSEIVNSIPSIPGNTQPRWLVISAIDGREGAVEDDNEDDGAEEKL